jgi:hypothetical protein
MLGYLLKLLIRIWRFGIPFSLKSGEFEPFLPPTKNPLYRSKLETIFFRSKFGENFAKKRGNKY